MEYMNTINRPLVDDVVLCLTHDLVVANLSRDLPDRIESERLTDEPSRNLFRDSDDNHGALDESFYKMRERWWEGLGYAFRQQTEPNDVGRVERAPLERLPLLYHAIRSLRRPRKYWRRLSDGSSK